MPEFAESLQILVRILIATVLGGMLGAEREIHGHGAGFRTHTMVAIGAAVFVMAALDVSASSPAELTRVLQGIATGIGFIGAGTILKLSDKIEVRGLTTASSIWLAAAIGSAVGLGQVLLALVGTLTAVIVLAVLKPLDRLFRRQD